MNKTTQTVESAAAGGGFHIEDVYPLIDGGRFAVKRIVGERVEVWADIYRDGHDVAAASLVWRREQDREWRREPMVGHGNDRWSGAFVPDAPGRYVYAIEAWTDEFATWRHGFELKQKAGSDLALDAIEGAGLLTKAQAGGPAAFSSPSSIARFRPVLGCKFAPSRLRKQPATAPGRDAKAFAVTSCLL